MKNKCKFKFKDYCNIYMLGTIHSQLSRVSAVRGLIMRRSLVKLVELVKYATKMVADNEKIISQIIGFSELCDQNSGRICKNN